MDSSACDIRTQGLTGALLAMNMYVLYVLTRVPEDICTVCTNRVPEYVCTVCTNKGT